MKQFQLPPVVVDGLQDVFRTESEILFCTGNGKAKSEVADAQRSFRKLFELAEVDGHPHMFRETFAVELLHAAFVSIREDKPSREVVPKT